MKELLRTWCYDLPAHNHSQPPDLPESGAERSDGRASRAKKGPPGLGSHYDPTHILSVEHRRSHQSGQLDGPFTASPLFVHVLKRPFLLTLIPASALKTMFGVAHGVSLNFLALNAGAVNP